MTRRLLGKMVGMISSRQDGEKRDKTRLEGVNDYWRQLIAEEIEAGEHKDFVGGFWEEIGDLQVEFLRTEGLLSGHRLVDIGCGSLRSGVRFVSYLDRGNYYGLDINASLIEAGRTELERLGFLGKQPNLLVDDCHSGLSYSRSSPRYFETVSGQGLQGSSRPKTVSRWPNSGS